MQAVHISRPVHIIFDYKTQSCRIRETDTVAQLLLTTGSDSESTAYQTLKTYILGLEPPQVSHSYYFKTPKSQNFCLYCLKRDSLSCEFSLISCEPQRTEMELLRSAVEHAYDAFIVLDEQARIHMVNRKTTQIFGYSAKELTSMTINDLNPTYTKEKWKAFLMRMETRDSDSISDTIITKYGNNIPVILSVSRVFSGGNLYFQLFIRDVSKEEELKQKLIRSRDFYLKVLDTFPAMIWRAGLDKRCNYFNQTWLEFTGKKMEQELGGGWTEGVHADDFDMCLNTYISSFDARNPFSMEYRLLNRFGEYRWILDIGRPLYDINDEFYGYLGACFDITEYRDLVDQVQKSNQSKSIFLANMSHDIRTPLAGIIGILDLILENNYEGGEKGKTELLRKALSSSKSLSELLNDIVDMTRIETGKLEIRPEPVSIPQLIQEACILFKIPIQEKNLKLHTTLDPMAPCLMDPVRLKQVLYNLLSNAWKYTDRGEIKIHLENRTHEGNPCFSISVSDTGRGIPKEDQPHIFQQFIQAKGLKSKGSGLGLSITRELVQMMNGKIWFESQRNMGSTFHIVLPFVSADMKKEKSDKTEHTLIHTNHQLKILIAEDNDVNRMIATTVLKKSGHVVYCAENGKEALNILSLKPVDLVLMDGSMPVMDGIEATSFIRSGENRDIPKDLPIIALTAHALKGDEQLFLSAGMNGYLTKPFNIDSFNEALHRLKF